MNPLVLSPSRPLSDRAVSLLTALALLCFCQGTQAQVGAPPAAGGTVTLTNTVANADGTYTFSGTYGTNANWAPISLTLYLSHDAAGGNTVLNVPGPALAGNTWTITTPAIQGNFTCWLLFQITKVGADPETQYITAPLKNIAAAGPGAGQPAPNCPLIWVGNNPVVRNIAGQISGTGGWTLAPGGWDWGTNPKPEMMCLPVGGGYVDSSPLAFTNVVRVGRQWTSTSNYGFAANDKYNVIAWSEAKNGAQREITATSFQLGK